jgi:hypothetical protein
MPGLFICALRRWCAPSTRATVARASEETPAMNYLIEIVGWAAALLLLVAYGLLSTGKVYGTSASYSG